MKRSSSCVLNLFFFLYYNEMLLASHAENEGFFKRIMLREVMSEEQECDEDKLLNYLAKLQAVNPESIINLAAVKDLKSFCSNLDANEKEMSDYLSTCTPKSQKDLYYNLIRGIQALDNKLCKDKHFQQDFMQYAECYATLGEEYQQCAGPADWIENPYEEQVCRVFKETTDCYYIKTALVCGHDSAKIFKELLVSVIDSIVRVKCNDVTENPEVPDVLQESQPSTKGKSSAFSLIPVFVILSIVIFAIVVYTTSRCLRDKKKGEMNEKKDSKRKESK